LVVSSRDDCCAASKDAHGCHIQNSKRSDLIQFPAPSRTMAIHCVAVLTHAYFLP
jgi:hypothetical protein